MDDNAKDALGKPVSGWKTAVTKIYNSLGMAFSVATVAIGAYGLIRGHKALGAAAQSQLEKMAVENVGKAVRVTGAALVGGGIVGGLVSKAGWDSASSASRTRNYLKLQQQLDAKEAGASRGA